MAEPVEQTRIKFKAADHHHSCPPSQSESNQFFFKKYASICLFSCAIIKGGCFYVPARYVFTILASVALAIIYALKVYFNNLGLLHVQFFQ